MLGLAIVRDDQLRTLLFEVWDTLANCYACNGGVTHQDDWPDKRCPICGDLREAFAPFSTRA